MTDPDFSNVYIDAVVRFVPVRKEDASNITSSLPSDDSEGVTEVDAECVEEYVSGSIQDPTFRMGKLPSADTQLIAVKPDSKISEATTLMMLHNFSQLPVMQNERTIKGVISWESIGEHSALGNECIFVRDCMGIAVEVQSESSLFSAIELIVKHGYVLVRQQDSRITGIVTTTDLSLQFRQLAEPFLLVGEIENYIRRLMDGKFTRDQLAEGQDPSDNRTINNVADLSFGEALRLIGRAESWDSLNIFVDRKIFIKHLDAIRSLRNDIMHFDPDPFSEADLETLRLSANFMRILDLNKPCTA